MKIPKNSSFRIELSKQFKKIFHQDTTFGELENLQNVNSADTYLQNKVSQLEEIKNGQEISKIANSIRQVHIERTRTFEKTDCNKGKKKNNSLETISI